jgi:hypothetical protein
MFARSDKSKMMLSAMMVIVVLAVAIPTCQMIGCNMGMVGGMMRISTHPGPTFSAPCDGTWVSSATQIGIVPSNFFAALVALVAVLAMAKMMFSPTMAARPLYIADSNAPPPPVEPRGERYLL